jgi:hypothetical protein
MDICCHCSAVCALTTMIIRTSYFIIVQLVLLMIGDLNCDVASHVDFRMSDVTILCQGLTGCQCSTFDLPSTVDRSMRRQIAAID